MTGRRCPLAAYGYSRDTRRDHPQITYGLLTDAAGRPSAVRVFPGNTADPTTFGEIPSLLRDTFGLCDVVVVGDRGMLTAARVDALRALGGVGWVTALRAPPRSPPRTGPLQLSLFDRQNVFRSRAGILAELPGELGGGPIRAVDRGGVRPGGGCWPWTSGSVPACWRRRCGRDGQALG